MLFPQYPSDDVNGSVTRVCNAPFNTLKKLHSLEADSLLKHANKLTLKSLLPLNHEKQNVSLVLQIFNEYTINALQTLGEKHNLLYYEDVASYIQIIHFWWTIINAKSTYKGIRHDNKYAAPITNDKTDEKYFCFTYYLFLLA